MNEQDRSALLQLKSTQATLELELSRLSRRIRNLEERLLVSPESSEPSTAVPRAPVLPAAPESVAPSRKPPPLPPIISAQTATISQLPGDTISGTPIGPKKTAVSPNSLPQPAKEAESIAFQAKNPLPPERSPLPTNRAWGEVSGQIQAKQKPESPKAGGSLEMRLGTYWLVRVGIVMVLTGLVFFGNLAYQNYISRLGPGGKVFLLYLASGALLSAGWWWQRRAVKESLRNYAQVLFAGGLAALYFTTYASHHIEPLRVIPSASVDGVLLLACAGLMVWAADRKKAEVLCLFAVGLAYYSAIITRVGAFTLWSNLVLTVAAVYFLVRNRWATLTYGSIVASYAAYAFWRFFNGSHWHWATPAEGLWFGAGFLLAYWMVFTAAVFLSRHEQFSSEIRATFLSFNNGAFFTLFLLTMAQVDSHGFWIFSLSYGVVLLALAAAARQLLAQEKLAVNAYLTQGLLLVTVGFISKFAGLQLALVLGAESVVLLMLSRLRQNRVLEVGAYLVAGLAVGWGMDGMRLHDPAGVYLALGLGALMLVNTVLVHKHLERTAELDHAKPSPLTESLRPQPSYFTVLALVIWLVATWNNAARTQFPLVLAAEGLLLTLSIYLLRIREIPFLSQIYVLVAAAAWFFNWFDSHLSLPWWNAALMLGLLLGLSHWWQKQTVLRIETANSFVLQVVYGLAFVAILYCWAGAHLSAPNWLVVTSAMALGLTAYAVATRAWMFLACVQIFLIASAAEFLWQLGESKPAWPFPLAPIAALGLLSGATALWFKRKSGPGSSAKRVILQIALIYRWVALALSLIWICEYIPARERMWVLGLLGFATFLLPGWRARRLNSLTISTSTGSVQAVTRLEPLLFSAVYTMASLVIFWMPDYAASRVYLPNLLAILFLAVEQQIARRMPEVYTLELKIQGAMIVLAGLSLWLLVSRWILQIAGGFYLTASWSVLALTLFGCGIVLRERVYRWVGLAVLASALGRVIIFDVWKLETLYRILSFMALGIVLLVLGFIYIKYEERIKEWL